MPFVRSSIAPRSPCPCDPDRDALELSACEVREVQLGEVVLAQRLYRLDARGTLYC